MRSFPANTKSERRWRCRSSSSVIAIADFRPHVCSWIVQNVGLDPWIPVSRPRHCFPPPSPRGPSIIGDLQGQSKGPLSFAARHIIRFKNIPARVVENAESRVQRNQRSSRSFRPKIERVCALAERLPQVARKVQTACARTARARRWRFEIRACAFADEFAPVRLRPGPAGISPRGPGGRRVMPYALHGRAPRPTFRVPHIASGEWRQFSDRE